MGEHAIVMGAGFGGLLAARALSPHFKRVTVVDRDALPEAPAPRDGVPQGKHIHVLMPGGLGALDRLFPGRVAELIENGATAFRLWAIAVLLQWQVDAKDPNRTEHAGPDAALSRSPYAAMSRGTSECRNGSR